MVLYLYVSTTDSDLISLSYLFLSLIVFFCDGDGGGHRPPPVNLPLGKSNMTWKIAYLSCLY